MLKRGGKDTKNRSRYEILTVSSTVGGELGKAAARSSERKRFLTLLKLEARKFYLTEMSHMSTLLV